jgi:hypothetical protein
MAYRIQNFPKVVNPIPPSLTTCQSIKQPSQLVDHRNNIILPREPNKLRLCFLCNNDHFLGYVQMFLPVAQSFSSSSSSLEILTSVPNHKRLGLDASPHENTFILLTTLGR